MKGFRALREIKGCQTRREMEGFTQAIGEKEENFVLYIDRVKGIARIIAIDRGDEIISEIELRS